MIRIVNFDLDAINELDALVLGLDLFGCELGFAGDERDLTDVDFAGKGIVGELHLGPKFDAAKVLFPDVSAEPGMLYVADRGNGGSGCNDLTLFGGFHQDNTVDRGIDGGVGELAVNDRDPRFGTVDFRTADGEFLLAAFEVDAIGFRQTNGGFRFLNLCARGFDTRDLLKS